MSRGTCGFLHVALMNGLGGMSVALEMHGRLLQSGMYQHTDKIKVGILGDRSQADHLEDYIFSRYPKYEVIFFSENLSLWEWPTLKALQGHCMQFDDDVWYMHTKGASNCRPDVPPRIQKNLRDWRGVMCLGMVPPSQVKESLRAFGAVGPLLSTDKGVPHFVGNFWWATAEHVLGLREITPELSKNRNEAEAWIGTNPASKMKGTVDLVAYDCYDFSNIFGEAGVFNGVPGAM